MRARLAEGMGHADCVWWQYDFMICVRKQGMYHGAHDAHAVILPTPNWPVLITTADIKVGNTHEILPTLILALHAPCTDILTGWK